MVTESVETDQQPADHRDGSLGLPQGREAVTGEPVVRVRGLRKTFRRANGSSVPAVDDISFDLYAGRSLVLLGPSGCGKTTLLRCIAGLEKPESGTIEVHGQLMYSSERGIHVPIEHRRLSMVFQSYALWPHMTVADNIAYPLRSLPRRSRPSKKEITGRVDQIMGMVGIDGLQRQHPNQLSGGQQQRVALSRALVSGSGLVLFDEPLSNVDAQVRESLRNELVSMQHELGFGALFVTHDRHEAMALATEIAVLDQGKIAQIDSPRQIYGAPDRGYVADFMGRTNSASVAAGEYRAEGGLVAARIGYGTITGNLTASASLDGPLLAIWRPERGVISQPLGDEPNSWPGKVEHATFLGNMTQYAVRMDADHVVHVFTGPDLELKVGEQVTVSVKPEHVYYLPGV